MREKTYLNRLEKNFDKFVEALNNAKRFSPVLFPFCNFKEGVLFGNENGVSYIAGKYIEEDGRKCYAIESLFDSFGRMINAGECEEATITAGTYTYDGKEKKAIRLTSKKYEVFINSKILGDYPDGARFYVTGVKNPVAVVYNGDIIKVVCPFYYPDIKFVEA